MLTEASVDAGACCQQTPVLTELDMPAKLLLLMLSVLPSSVNTVLCSQCGRVLFSLQHEHTWADDAFNGAEQKGLVMLDISGGKEKARIPVFNTVDDEGPRAGLQYIRHVVMTTQPAYEIKTTTVSCNCIQPCSHMVTRLRYTKQHGCVVYSVYSVCRQKGRLLKQTS